VTPSPRCIAALCLAAVAAGCAAPAATPAAPPAATPTPVVAPTPPPPAVRHGPQVSRFVAHQRVEIFNEFAGLPPRQELGFRTWFAVTVRDSLDPAARRPAVFTIDSMAADSGVLLPPMINLAAARGLTVRGWLAANGEFVDQVFSDSTAATTLSRLLGFFRRFFPHLPPDGARPGASWSDSTTTTEPGGQATLTRTAALRASAGDWETRDGVLALRVDVVETYQFTGSGESGGQQLSLTGGGMRSGTDYLGADGRYLGGVSRDSASLTITLPLQGVSVPQRQVATLAITVLAP
jgi:hypothetical protein